MAKVEFIWTTSSESGERAWILDQEIDIGADPEEGAWILEGQLNQKKYTRHDGLVDWLQSLPKEEGPIRPPFDIYISTFVNKNGVTNVQRIEVASQRKDEKLESRPSAQNPVMPQKEPRKQSSRLRTGCLWLNIGFFALVILSALMQSPT